MTAPPLVLQWGRERYMIKYDYEDLRETTLGQFKEVCREVTATMKDDASPLAYYGIYPGASVKLIGRKEDAEKRAPPTKEEREEHALIHKIDDISNEACDRLSSPMQAYLTNAQLYMDQFGANAAGGIDDKALLKIKAGERKKLTDTYKMVNETLMQYLLKVDDIVCPADADKARQRRKQAVRQLQAWMDQMDRKRDSVDQSEATVPQ
ncbi:hypothetical protein LPJ61_001101 [Coemansia biformis]|uniref:BAG domain-containing protein n=1 Tax=Coemansia biformis TaxID=1286918 RepID=A0A9W7YGM7_9FUNG|nr:hypothetical protein LPJ61_001101 [Coemansia biformis]